MKILNVGELEINAVHKYGNSINVNTSKILARALGGSASNGEAEATIKDHEGKK